jgi:hypothetical protein
MITRWIEHIRYNLHPEVYKFTLVEWAVVIAASFFGGYYGIKALLNVL